MCGVCGWSKEVCVKGEEGGVCGGVGKGKEGGGGGGRKIGAT